MKIFLDDERIGVEGWITVRPSEFPSFYNENCELIEKISFDHDLGCDEHGKEYPSGYDFFREIEHQYYIGDIIPPYMYVHSANPSGSRNLVLGIESLNRRVGRSYYDPRIFPDQE